MIAHPESIPDELPDERILGRRCDLEGELTCEIVGQQYVILLDDARVNDLLTYHFRPTRGENGLREFGRVRLTVERIVE